MKMSLLLLGLLATVSFVHADSWVSVKRPDASSWKRTMCGSPSGTSPAIPAGPYTTGMDYPGNDMAPCGSKGCVLPTTSAQPQDCEAKCNSTVGCVAWIYAPSDCSGAAGPICWTKSSVGHAVKATCRNSRVMGQPATTGADIPSKWAAQVSSSITPLPAYPRPQMVRGGSDRDHGNPDTWYNLNGLWEWEPATSDAPPVGRTLNQSILVPFPVESCLSGVAPASSADLVQTMWYRLVFSSSHSGSLALRFGAVDWQSSVYLNGAVLGNHTGGYDGFSYDLTPHMKPGDNELLVRVFDPSDQGAQPNGKQRISAIDNPGGDTYTPSSGIWQTVWLEALPDQSVQDIKIDQASQHSVTLTVQGEFSSFVAEVHDGAGAVARVTGAPGRAYEIEVPSPKLWSPSSPHLYDLVITTATDTVTAYFGLRTFVLGDGPLGKRPVLNGNFTFLAGFLDQSFWPDGQYTAPTDEALAYDIEAVPMFGLNMIRLHQKVNPERWYYHADRIGVVVFQDMVQKYGGASSATVPLFVEDFKAMVTGRGNHPCIVQFTTFNEGDCWEVFKTKPYDVPGIVALGRQLDPTRLIDTDSGGGANNLHIGDVDDIHSYPYPGDPKASSTQYGMVGEFGGIGAFVAGKEWKPKSCHTYLKVDSPADEAAAYIKMAATLQSRVDHVSASVYTQTTDVELECDGFLNYDRSNKFSDADTAAIRNANQAIIQASRESPNANTF